MIWMCLFNTRLSYESNKSQFTKCFVTTKYYIMVQCGLHLGTTACHCCRPYGGNTLILGVMVIGIHSPCGFYIVASAHGILGFCDSFYTCRCRSPVRGDHFRCTGKYYYLNISIFVVWNKKVNFVAVAVSPLSKKLVRCIHPCMIVIHD